MKINICVAFSLINDTWQDSQVIKDIKACRKCMQLHVGVKCDKVQVK